MGRACIPFRLRRPRRILSQIALRRKVTMRVGVLGVDCELSWLAAGFLSTVTLEMSAAVTSMSFNFSLTNVMISSTAVRG